MAHQFELMDVPDLGDDDDVSYLRSLRRGTNNTLASGGGLCYHRSSMSIASQKDESSRSVISTISADGGSVLSGTAATYPEWLALRQANHNHSNHNNLPSLPNRLVEEAPSEHTTHFHHQHHQTKDDNTSSTSSATDDASDPHLSEHDRHHQSIASSDHFPTHFSSNNTVASSSSKSTSYRTGCFSSEGYRRNLQHVQQRGYTYHNTSNSNSNSNSNNNHNNSSIADDEYSICRVENDEDTLSRQPMPKGSNKSIASYSQNTDHNIKVDMTVRTEPHPLE